MPFPWARPITARFVRIFDGITGAFLNSMNVNASSRLEPADNGGARGTSRPNYASSVWRALRSGMSRSRARARGRRKLSQRVTNRMHIHSGSPASPAARIRTRRDSRPASRLFLRRISSSRHAPRSAPASERKLEMKFHLPEIPSISRQRPPLGNVLRFSLEIRSQQQDGSIRSPAREIPSAGNRRSVVLCCSATTTNRKNQ